MSAVGASADYGPLHLTKPHLVELDQGGFGKTEAELDPSCRSMSSVDNFVTNATRTDGLRAIPAARAEVGSTKTFLKQESENTKTTAPEIRKLMTGV
jgi:hypothetical protein